MIIMLRPPTLWEKNLRQRALIGIFDPLPDAILDLIQWGLRCYGIFRTQADAVEAIKTV